MRRVLFAALRHPLAVFGLALTTASALLFLVLFLLDVTGQITNHYVGLVTYVAMPALFVAGLVGIAVGARLGRTGPVPAWPRIDLNQPRQRQVLALLALATGANLVVVSLATYGGVTYMETDEFCGQVCHAPMRPQFTAHQEGPHARIACVACHIEPGAGGFFAAKLSGAGRLISVATGGYDRPIRQARGEGSSTRETRERCHWSELRRGDRPTPFREFADDEANTEVTTALRLHVGGGPPGQAEDIHWHASAATMIDYVAVDGSADEIPIVRVTASDGTVREYRGEGADTLDLESAVTRRMDCLDCHNRPAHAFATSAARAVDAALAVGRLDPTLPFIRREAVRLLNEDYDGTDTAGDAIAVALDRFYTSNYPDLVATAPDRVRDAAAGVQALAVRNLFPDMGIDWGTHRRQIGHADERGCFRCHDERHVTDDGATIGQDCELCHSFE